MILSLIDEAVAAGARAAAASAALGLSVRTIERWRAGATEDDRHGPNTAPANALSQKEREAVIATMNLPEYRDLSPNQIVPLLADAGRYLASESTLYRILREEDLLHHRERSRAPVRRPPSEHVATGPNQVCSWDITYLRTAVMGMYFYLYLVVDVWSRRIVGWEVHVEESSELAGALIDRICKETGVDPRGLVLHSDNGSPMKGSTMLATLQRLGVVPSFSRPHVSDDNPFSEALFRTLKYCPQYPTGGFATVEAARAWVSDFVVWYNTVHLHSGIRFVTPDDRHFGREGTVLAARKKTYEEAKAAHPERWTGPARCWDPVGDVYLNPETPAPASGGPGALVPGGAGQSPAEASPSVEATASSGLRHSYSAQSQPAPLNTQPNQAGPRLPGQPPTDRRNPEHV
jgi:transposase InsO family protein